MKKLAILCVLACALVACEKPMNNGEETPDKFTQAVKNDLEVLNGTFARIVNNELYHNEIFEKYTFVPFPQPIGKIGSKSGEVIYCHGTFDEYYRNDYLGKQYFYIKPASDPEKSEVFLFSIDEENTDYYRETSVIGGFYYTIINKDTIVVESFHPIDALERPKTFTRI